MIIDPDIKDELVNAALGAIQKKAGEMIEYGEHWSERAEIIAFSAQLSRAVLELCKLTAEEPPSIEAPQSPV